MVFSSNIFLLYFMPIFFLVYFIMPRKIRNFFLLLASLVFYAWGINRGHGLLVNLGLFPEEPEYPVVEVRPELPVNEKLISGKRRLWSSDAHHLGDILEAVSELDTDRFSLGGLFELIKNEK